jgi:uncharacterized protein YutE (UPF0331/DUF86 family)
MLKKKGVLIITILAAVLIFVTVVAESTYDTLYSYLKMSSDVAYRIKSRYVDEIDSKTLKIRVSAGCLISWIRFRNILRPKTTICFKK